MLGDFSSAAVGVNAITDTFERLVDGDSLLLARSSRAFAHVRPADTYVSDFHAVAVRIVVAPAAPAHDDHDHVVVRPPDTGGIQGLDGAIEFSFVAVAVDRFTPGERIPARIRHGSLVEIALRQKALKEAREIARNRV